MADTTLPGVLLKGVAASRPAANAVAKGTIYSATDTGAITQSDGVSTWSTYATISSGLADPMTTRGDIIVRNASNTTARLAIGSTGKVLSSDGTDVSWASPAGSGARARRFALASGVSGGTTVAATWATAPASTSILFAVFAGVVATTPAVSSISQTNVTWTLLHANHQGSPIAADVEVWKGVPSGTPGTTTTATMGSTIQNTIMSCLEWTGTLAGTLDQSADNSGASGTSQGTGKITPTANALVFAVAAVANGGTQLLLSGPSPWTPFLNIGAPWGAIAYCVSAGGEEAAQVLAQSSGAWANTIVSVI